MAAVGQFDIEHVYLNEYWTNRYLTDLLPADPLAGPVMDTILMAHRTLLTNGAQVTRIRHSSLAEGDNDYIIRQHNLAGLRAIAALDMLPLFCTARIDFTATAGRPSRKYLRGVLGEGDISAMNISTAWKDGLGADYITMILSEPNIVDPQGDTLLQGTVALPVQMRQLRRGSRRRTEPVL